MEHIVTAADREFISLALVQQSAAAAQMLLKQVELIIWGIVQFIWVIYIKILQLKKFVMLFVVDYYKVFDF